MSAVVKTQISNSLKTDFRIICIQEGKTISRMIEELLGELIQAQSYVPLELKLSSHNPVVLKGYIPEELKKEFKVFCTERKITMNVALYYLINKRVSDSKREPKSISPIRAR
ncbi:MAG: hypothetical protein AAFQ80_24785 [Cyanobacteria bacterium J06621_8]